MRIKYVFMSFALFFAATPVFAAEQIKDFAVEATLSPDRNFAVTEKITYDFDTVLHHGIERVIPVTYERNGAKYRLHLSFGTALMDGENVNTKVTSGGDVVRLRLGDPDVNIKGLHAYTIPYQTARAINTFEDAHELYWNVTGDGWNVPIQAARFVLHAPAPATKVTCFTGHLGETTSDCTVEQKGNDLTVKLKRPLAEQEGLTVVASFPLTSMASLTVGQKIQQFVEDNAWALLPVLVFVVMYAIWRKYGREPKGRGTVIAQYEVPRKLSPAEMASLMEQKVSMKAVTATILDLARRGYLHLKYREEKTWLGGTKNMFSLVSKKEPDESLQEFETTVWNGLFDGVDEEVELKDLKGPFWTALEAAREEVFDALRAKKLFGKNPSLARGGWTFAAMCLFIGSFWLIPAFGIAFLISGWVSAIIIAAFGWQMPRKTEEGAVAHEEIEGFKLFLSVTEKDRLDFTDAPERTPEQFAAFLPAAVAFGVEEKWAKQFAGLDIRPNYVEGTPAGWNAMNYSTAMDQFHAASAASMYSAPSSTAGGGGSGFSGGGSGGGFGGGGGGSW